MHSGLGFIQMQRKPRQRNLCRGVSSGYCLVNLGDDTGANGTAALADSEAEALLDGDGGDQFHGHHNVIAGHAHLNALGQVDDAGHVGGTEVELGTIVVEEGFPICSATSSLAQSARTNASSRSDSTPRR